MKNDIGVFIQKVRKNKGFTQKELAEKIGVSDKTISKWENGNSIPDTSMLLPLCNELEITVNELLSCEIIAPENYPLKAEETILALVKENENSKKNDDKSNIIGIVVVFIALFILGVTHAGISFIVHLDYFLNVLSIIEIVILEVGIVFICKAKEKKTILHVLNKTILPVGAILSMASGIYGMYDYNDLYSLGPILWGIVTPLLYTFIAKCVVEILLIKEQLGEVK